MKFSKYPVKFQNLCIMLGAVSLVLTKELDGDQKSDIIEQFTHKIIINLLQKFKKKIFKSVPVPV